MRRAYKSVPSALDATIRWGARPSVPSIRFRKSTANEIASWLFSARGGKGRNCADGPHRFYVRQYLYLAAQDGQTNLPKRDLAAALASSSALRGALSSSAAVLRRPPQNPALDSPKLGLRSDAHGVHASPEEELLFSVSDLCRCMLARLYCILADAEGALRRA